MSSFWCLDSEFEKNNRITIATDSDGHPLLLNHRDNSITQIINGKVEYIVKDAFGNRSFDRQFFMPFAHHNGPCFVYEPMTGDIIEYYMYKNKVVISAVATGGPKVIREYHVHTTYSQQYACLFVLVSNENIYSLWSWSSPRRQWKYLRNGLSVPKKGFLTTTRVGNPLFLYPLDFNFFGRVFDTWSGTWKTPFLAGSYFGYNFEKPYLKATTTSNNPRAIALLSDCTTFHPPKKVTVDDPSLIITIYAHRFNRAIKSIYRDRVRGVVWAIGEVRDTNIEIGRLSFGLPFQWNTKYVHLEVRKRLKTRQRKYCSLHSNLLKNLGYIGPGKNTMEFDVIFNDKTMAVLRDEFKLPMRDKKNRITLKEFKSSNKPVVVTLHIKEGPVGEQHYFVNRNVWEHVFVEKGNIHVASKKHRILRILREASMNKETRT